MPSVPIAPLTTRTQGRVFSQALARAKSRKSGPARPTPAAAKPAGDLRRGPKPVRGYKSSPTPLLTPRLAALTLCLAMLAVVATG